MAAIGIFFGTDTGRTRLVAKQIARKLEKLGKAAAAPVNIGRTGLEQFLAHDALILGTPTLGEGALPSAENTTLSAKSWAEFLPELEGIDLSGKVVALYGLGDQLKYPEEFVDAMGLIHEQLVECGARVVGQWPTEGYEFKASRAVRDGMFVGLPLDQHNQADQTESRLDAWLARILAELQP